MRLLRPIFGGFSTNYLGGLGLRVRVVMVMVSTWVGVRFIRVGGMVMVSMV